MRLLDEFVQDARYAIRRMTRNTGFTAVVLLTLALGIGANTAIFSVLYGVCLSPVKYANPERLVDISMQQVSGRRFMGGTSYLNLADWKAQARTVEVFGAHRYTHEVNVTGTEGAEEVIGHRVSANLFHILGTRPVLGHPLAGDADRSAGPRQVLIGDAWWKQRFGADPGVVGRRIQVDDETFTIAGVMAPGFEFPPMGSKAYRPVMWMSLNLPPEQEHAREAHSLSVIARLKPGVSMHQAQAEMDTIAARLVSAYPHENGGWGIKVAKADRGQTIGCRTTVAVAGHGGSYTRPSDRVCEHCKPAGGARRGARARVRGAPGPRRELAPPCAPTIDGERAAGPMRRHGRNAAGLFHAATFEIDVAAEHAARRRDWGQRGCAGIRGNRIVNNGTAFWADPGYTAAQYHRHGFRRTNDLGG